MFWFRAMNFIVLGTAMLLMRLLLQDPLPGSTEKLFSMTFVAAVMVLAFTQKEIVYWSALVPCGAAVTGTLLAAPDMLAGSARIIQGVAVVLLICLGFLFLLKLEEHGGGIDSFRSWWCPIEVLLSTSVVTLSVWGMFAYETPSAPLLGIGVLSMASVVASGVRRFIDRPLMSD